MEAKQTLVYQAAIATRSGYGDHSRDLLKSLKDLNKFDIKIISTRWGQTPMDALSYDDPFHKWIIDNLIQKIEGNEKPDIYIQVTVPNEFQPLGHYNIGVSAGIETSVCNMDWIPGCNKMDLIIMTSEHSRMTTQDVIYNKQDSNTKQIVEVIRTTKPFEILFEGYDEKIFNENNIVPIKEIDEIKEDFCFLTVGHWLKGDVGEDRKNVSMLIKTFPFAFKNETIKPALILKVSSATFSVMDREAIIIRIKTILGDDYGKIPIYLLHGYLSETEMNSLYRHPKVKAMVSFTKGEGYGRPFLEFTLTGKPLIVSGWSGHLDFLKSGAVLLEGELKGVHESAVDQFIIKDSKWFNVNVSKAIMVLKDVFKNYNKYLEAAKPLKENNIKNLTLSKMTERLDEILKKHSIYDKKRPKFQQLQLPKLRTLNDQL
jgi:hypothetical protein